MRVPTDRRSLRFLIPIVLVAFAGGTPSAVLGKNIVVRVLNETPSSGYRAEKNGALVASANSSPAGVVSVIVAANNGDQLRVSASGAAVPPAAPTGLAATGSDVGCAGLAWAANAEGDVILYRVYYRKGSGAFTDSLSATATAASVCGLVDGTWTFAVRALNATGLVSALSFEKTASVSNGSAQPPLPPAAVSASSLGSGCIRIVWSPSGDPNVVGYTVGYGPSPATGGNYPFTADAGSGTSFDLCNLVSGTWYVAVRARNHLGMLSIYSLEKSTTVVATAILVQRFDARAEGVAVRLSWRVIADEPLRGFRVLRRDGDTAVDVSGAGLLSRATDTFVDTGVGASTRYEYALAVVRADGSEVLSAPALVTTAALSLQLEQNVPNPFNPATTIAFVLPTQTHATLSIYDVRGARVVTLVDAELSAGRRSIPWDGRDDKGGRVGSGVYFYRLVTPAHSQTRKMILLK